jgi:hypothetical protein
VNDLLPEWELGSFSDAASLCATELTSNAVLHSRQPFVLTIRPAGGGVRLDVLDNSPEKLPVFTPAYGSAVDLTSLGTGGRGLQIVASFARRWGVFATEDSKTVWIEIAAESSDVPPAPLIKVPAPVSVEGLITLTFLDLPVRAAVASGIQTEEVIREIQLDQSANPLDSSLAARLFALVDGSAPVRLAGRHAALRSAAESQERFDLVVNCTRKALRCLPELSNLLAAYELDRALPLPTLTPEVIAFRRWLNRETAAQLAGAAPAPCLLAT